MDNFDDNISYDVFNINFKIEEDTPIMWHELSIFNYDFVGNKSTCDIKQVEDVSVLAYKIPATLPLEQFLRKQLYKAEFLAMLSSIMKQLMYFEGNDLPVKKVLLNIKYMFIELSKLDIQLLYMPLEKSFSDSNVTAFIQTFISKIRFADMKSVDVVERILNYLDSRKMFLLIDFYNYILELQKESLEDELFVDEYESETRVLVSNVEYRNPMPYLVRLKTNELISISKDIFNIGKSMECEYSVSDNKKVSRIHATFKISNGECYIKDNNSTNHTYINGRLIQPGFDVMLENDDYIRLGNEEFKYWLK